MPPELILLFKGFVIYAIIGFVLHLVARLLEVLEYFRNAERWGQPFHSYKVRQAWGLVDDDAQTLVYVLFCVFWCVGVFVMPFYYHKAIWYAIGYPFKRLGVNLWPSWLTIDSIVGKMNSSRRAKGELK